MRCSLIRDHSGSGKPNAAIEASQRELSPPMLPVERGLLSGSHLLKIAQLRIRERWSGLCLIAHPWRRRDRADLGRVAAAAAVIAICRG